MAISGAGRIPSGSFSKPREGVTGGEGLLPTLQENPTHADPPPDKQEGLGQVRPFDQRGGLKVFAADQLPGLLGPAMLRQRVGGELVVEKLLVDTSGELDGVEQGSHLSWIPGRQIMRKESGRANGGILDFHRGAGGTPGCFPLREDRPVSRRLMRIGVLSCPDAARSAL